MQIGTFNSRTTKVVFLIAAALSLVVSAALIAGPADAKKQRRSHKSELPIVGPCQPIPTEPGLQRVRSSDVWLSSEPYSFPFYGYTNRGNGPVIWKKIRRSGMRKTHYPAPNLPSCRVAARGTEDRTSRKANRFMRSLLPIDGRRDFILRDSFDRPVARLHWERRSLVKKHRDRWGWYLNGKWAGHGATRAFEIQGNACKLRVQTETVMVGNPPVAVTVRRWVRDHQYAMIAFNPALGSPGRRYRPRRTSTLRLRAFIDKRAIPRWVGSRMSRIDFGCGQSPLTPMLGPQMLTSPRIQSGYEPSKHRREYMVGQYFGESASPVELLPGESKTHNNMPYSSYNAKPQFDSAMYAMINTTGVAGGGMVRGIARAWADQFILHDEMRYCDPNYTLRHMLLRRNGKRVSKWSYFELAQFNRLNQPSVRWVFGRIAPDPSTLTPEGQQASLNPASQGMFAWIPVRCDR